MHKLSFDETMKRFDLIVSDMNDANKKNNTMFRRICKEVFQKSYAEFRIQNNLNIGGKMAGTGIVSVIQKARGQYKEGSFVKSFKKLNHKTSVFTYSDLNKINNFLQIAEFVFVVRLLKIQHNYGLNSSVSYVISH